MPLFKRTLSEFLFRRFMLKQYGSNLLLDMNLEAKRDTFDYIKRNMPDAPYFEKHPALVKYALDQVTKDGLYLVFGVGRGGVAAGGLVWWREADSNRRLGDYETPALPPELPRQ